MTYTAKNHWLDRDETADTMLEIMKECRVFKVLKKGYEFEVIECCDEYFGATLTKEQMLALADEIKALANSVQPESSRKS
jgi:hypothetical protein